MLSAWVLLAVAAGILATAVVSGVWLWWPARGEASSRSDLGVALMTGTLVAFSVLLVQVLFDSRSSRLEDLQRAAQASRDRILQRQSEQQSLALAIGIQHDLSGIDLQDRDLSGFVLVRKRLDEAMLTGSDLSDASLIGAHLRGAFLDDTRLARTILTGADLRGAYIRGSKLLDTDFSGANLRGADLTDAVVRGAAFGGARYDSTTRWPRRITVEPCPAGQTCVVGASGLAARR